MSGEAFTTRLEITFDLVLQLFGVNLDRIHLGTSQRLDEFTPAQSRNLGRLAL